MDLLLTDEQQEIAEAAASFLAGQLPIARIRDLIETDDPVDGASWAGAADQGWFALGLSEDDGGVGFALADEALLFREIGRSLAPGPYLATVLAARVAVGRADELAEGLLGGTSRSALGVADGAVAVGPDRVTGSWRLLDGVGAQYVFMGDDQGAAVVATADLDARPEVCLDEGSRVEVCDGVDVVPVAYVAASDDPIGRRGLVLSAAMLVGIAEACRDISVEHAKTREQFDRPIGVHQAVKHPVADMAVRVECAWPAVLVAALASEEGRADAEFQSLSARLVAADAAARNGRATIQVLGGMGFTYEHDANLFVKRAKVLEKTFGGRQAQLARLLALPVGM
jgi:alkylation response protein AidB-like acyl-CoA dehydrogenase